MNIRMIACDIDGTLLPFGATSLRPSIFGHIERLRQKGILFCPASGRQYGSLRKLFAPVADELCYICENGAILYGPGTPGPVWGKTVMDWDRAIGLSHSILSAPGCEVMLSGENTCYLCTWEERFVAYIRDTVGNNFAILDTPEQMPEEIIKVSAFCRNGTKKAEPFFTEERTCGFQYVVAGEYWLDFMTANKETGLRQLCSNLNMDPKEVLAFGDNYNDMPMLESAGFAYLVETAAPELKKRIPNVCKDVEEILKTL